MPEYPILKAGSASDVISRAHNRTVYMNILQQELATEAGIQGRVELQKGGGGASSSREVSVIGPTLFTVDEQKTNIGNIASNLATNTERYQRLSNILLTRYGITWDLGITYGNGPTSSDITGMSALDIVTGVTDQGYPWGGASLAAATSGGLPRLTTDDGNVNIPMGGMSFKFFGLDYGAADAISWNSNNALVFGVLTSSQTNVSGNITVSSAIKAILLGNYDRHLISIYRKSYTSGLYSVVSLLITFADYYTAISPTYVYQVRLISGNSKQWIEVSVISSPPSPGYSSAIATYPSGTLDTNSIAIDATKNSPYNITNAGAFLNPCGSTFSLASPPAGTSFVFQSDSTGTTWSFTNNGYLAI